jgi:anti-sigma factor RsiW
MKCKDIEHLVIESSKDELSAEDLSRIKQHILHCSKCAQLEDDLKKIRIFLKKTAPPSPPVELVRQTQLMCHTEINAFKAGVKKFPGLSSSRLIPKYMWAALIMLITLTVILFSPLLTEFNLEQPLSFQAVVVLFLMIQNAGMLFFAPVLIRKYRSTNRSLVIG